MGPRPFAAPRRLARLVPATVIVVVATIVACGFDGAGTQEDASGTSPLGEGGKGGEGSPGGGGEGGGEGGAGDASNDVKGASDAPRDTNAGNDAATGAFRCGFAQPCGIGQVCCVSAASQPRCVAAGACNGVVALCGGPPTCLGLVCCAALDSSDTPLSVSCVLNAQACTSGNSKVICDIGSGIPCTGGFMCKPQNGGPLAGYDLCK